MPVTQSLWGFTQLETALRRQQSLSNRRRHQPLTARSAAIRDEKNTASSVVGVRLKGSDHSAHREVTAARDNPAWRADFASFLSAARMYREVLGKGRRGSRARQCDRRRWSDPRRHGTTELFMRRLPHHLRGLGTSLPLSKEVAHGTAVRCTRRKVSGGLGTHGLAAIGRERYCYMATTRQPVQRRTQQDHRRVGRREQ